MSAADPRINGAWQQVSRVADNDQSGPWPILTLRLEGGPTADEGHVAEVSMPLA